MEMRRQHFFCNSFKALGSRFVNCSDWRQALHITTVPDLRTTRRVLADPLNEADRFHRQARLEEYHFDALVSSPAAGWPHSQH
jgi:hypothetical protein